MYLLYLLDIRCDVKVGVPMLYPQVALSTHTAQCHHRFWAHLFVRLCQCTYTRKSVHCKHALGCCVCDRKSDLRSSRRAAALRAYVSVHAADDLINMLVI